MGTVYQVQGESSKAKAEPRPAKTNFLRGVDKYFLYAIVPKPYEAHQRNYKGTLGTKSARRATQATPAPCTFQHLPKGERLCRGPSDQKIATPRQDTANISPRSSNPRQTTKEYALMRNKDSPRGTSHQSSQLLIIASGLDKTSGIGAGMAIALA